MAVKSVTASLNNTTYALSRTSDKTHTEETADLRNVILKNSLGNRMLDMVAPIYDKSRVALHLFQVLGTILEPELDFVWGDFISQIFPQTATWSLRYWEDEYGILTDESKTIEQRRAYLISLMHKNRSMTPKRLEQIVKGVTGFNCEIIENIAPNTFLVTIRGYVPDLSPVKSELNKKAPAHLIYEIRMAELVEIKKETVTGFAVHEAERYEVEVLS